MKIDLKFASLLGSGRFSATDELRTSRNNHFADRSL